MNWQRKSLLQQSKWNENWNGATEANRKKCNQRFQDHELFNGTRWPAIESVQLVVKQVNQWMELGWGCADGDGGHRHARGRRAAPTARRDRPLGAQPESRERQPRVPEECAAGALLAARSVHAVAHVQRHRHRAALFAARGAARPPAASQVEVGVTSTSSSSSSIDCLHADRRTVATPSLTPRFPYNIYIYIRFRSFKWGSSRFLFSFPTVDSEIGRPRHIEVCRPTR